MSDERYRRGLATIEQVMGEGGSEGLVSLAEDAPELARYAIEAFGELYADQALDVRTRELLTVAALTAMGNAPSQLKTHVGGALIAGCTEAEVVAAITQMYAYAGFPSALNGLTTALETFRERNEHRRGPG